LIFDNTTKKFKTKILVKAFGVKEKHRQLNDIIMVIKSIDTFIERSILLLEARPTSTKVSLTYTHRRAESKKAENDETVGGGRPAVLVVKTYDPVSGTCFKVRVSRSNELSRIWSALGPRGVSVTKTDHQKSPVSVKRRGLASIMAGVDIEYTEEAEPEPVETKIEPTTSKKKKTKRK
jgi:hypothetical protein